MKKFLTLFLFLSFSFFAFNLVDVSALELTEQQIQNLEDNYLDPEYPYYMVFEDFGSSTINKVFQFKNIPVLFTEDIYSSVSGLDFFYFATTECNSIKPTIINLSSGNYSSTTNIVIDQNRDGYCNYEKFENINTTNRLKFKDHRFQGNFDLYMKVNSSHMPDTIYSSKTSSGSSYANDNLVWNYPGNDLPDFSYYDGSTQFDFSEYKEYEFQWSLKSDNKRSEFLLWNENGHNGLRYEFGYYGSSSNKVMLETGILNDNIFTTINKEYYLDFNSPDYDTGKYYYLNLLPDEDYFQESYNNKIIKIYYKVPEIYNTPEPNGVIVPAPPAVPPSPAELEWYEWLNPINWITFLYDLFLWFTEPLRNLAIDLFVPDSEFLLNYVTNLQNTILLKIPFIASFVDFFSDLVNYTPPEYGENYYPLPTITYQPYGLEQARIVDLTWYDQNRDLIFNWIRYLSLFALVFKLYKKGQNIL